MSNSRKNSAKLSSWPIPAARILKTTSSAPASMAAVASVIRNRLAAGGYGRSPTEIVHAPNQFEAWNPPSGEGPERFDEKSPAYKQAATLAQGVFNGIIQDQTHGATHFVAPAAQADLGRSMPGWAKGDPLASIGGHQFYAPNGAVGSDKLAGLGGSTGPGLRPGDAGHVTR
jgi:spore germination cell wall hydrolase CwlJ-like protein